LKFQYDNLEAEFNEMKAVNKKKAAVKISNICCLNFQYDKLEAEFNEMKAVNKKKADV
jgi:hypothetical protein